jgi:uncharacterized RDD family membrane protein YckC
MPFMPSELPQLDASIDVVTPENIALQYRLAGPFLRLPAYLVDFAIRAVVMFLGWMALALTFGVVGLRQIGVGAGFLLWFLLDWFYGGLFETFLNGQTPGKRLVGVRVLTVDGQPINGLQAVLRNVLRAIDCQPFYCYQVGLIACAMNDRFQRLGDLVCGTMVVIEHHRWLRGLVRIKEPEVLRLAEQIPPGFLVSRTTARALAAYVERRSYFSSARRWEIARHLGEPLRTELDLPPGADYDRLLCALYHRTFITDAVPR